MTEPKRIRFPSLLAIIGGLIVFATLTFLNLDGYHNEPYSPGGFSEEPPNINWTHGWPFVCMGRGSVGTGPLMVRVVQMTLTSRWPFDGTPVTYLYRNALCADLAILVASVAATVWGINSLVRRSSKRLSYGLRFLFVLMTVAAVASIGLPYLASRLIQYRIAMAILALAAGIVILATAQLGIKRLRQPYDDFPI
jgi:hypothetical protein